MTVLRQATTTDLEFMRALRNANASRFFNTKKIDKITHKKWFSQFAGIFYIILVDDVPVGTISISASPKEPLLLEIGNVIIDKNYRRQGILKETINIIKSWYGDCFYVRVKGSNKDAIAAYKRLGFTVRSLTMEL